jgi:hypothetical protein
MLEATCPACYQTVELAPYAALLGKTSRCSHCWALLEVTNEHPLRVVERREPGAAAPRGTT